CAGTLFGRAPFCAVPNPCGPRPRSVVLPCASQLRPVLGRLTLDPLPVARPMAARLLLAIAPLAEGGRLRDSSFCRAVMPELFGEVAPKPGRPVFACVRPTTLLRGELLWTEAVRPGDKLAVFMVRT